MLVWEISAGQPLNHGYDNDLVISIINGMRPKILPETPLEYNKLMKQCWDADPLKGLILISFGKEWIQLIDIIKV